jgi:16S rRNA (guanine527-N7)-methyltransferase
MRVEATPPLPPEYDIALKRGLAALGLDLDPDARAAIDGHVRLLLAWTPAINLTAIREPAEVATGHVLDSLTGLRILRARAVDRFVDLGSGGGFPGLPLAAARPARRAVLLDSIAKKVRFLVAAIGATGLDDRVETLTARAEGLAADPAHRERWPAVTARAVAPLAELVELSFPLLEPRGVLIAWKRGYLDPELAAARRAVADLGGGSIEVEDAAPTIVPEHRLVTVTKAGHTPAPYPRDPAARRARPWRP